MAKRSIEDREIALIKAMLDRGMRNKDIQFYFNRPERSVNSGRISTIGTGSYSNSSEISAASEAELNAFIAEFDRDGGGKEVDDGFDSHARRAFRRLADGSWCLHAGETEEHECKVEFDPKKMTHIVRSIAALANNNGGFIFFGISNKGFKVEGVNQAFVDMDIVGVVEKVKAHLAPTPSISAKGIIDLGGLSVGFIRVERHVDRPVIVYRDGDGLHEGEILYRYAGQSARIKFADLRAMLEERDRRAQVSLAKAAERLADMGLAKAMIIDTERNILEADGRSILIDQELVDSIQFIKEGEFNERTGAPTLKLVGEIGAVAVPVEKISREAIFQENIVNAFLKSERVENPLHYIMAGLAQSRVWLPIFYFARASGLTNSEVAARIRAQKVSQKGKQRILLERLDSQKTALTKSVTQSAQSIAKAVSAGTIPIPASSEELLPLAQGITSVEATSLPIEKFLEALRASRDLAEKADDGNALGAIYKAVCRVDEMFFGRDV